MLSLVLGSRFVENAFQIVETLKLLDPVESGAGAGIQLEDGKRLFEGILG